MKNDKNSVLKLRAEACLKSLPAQLSKEYKKFQFSLADANIGSSQEFDTLPLHSLGFLPKRPKSNIISAVDVKNIKIPEAVQ